jgi:hypothetical protein
MEKDKIFLLVVSSLTLGVIIGIVVAPNEVEKPKDLNQEIDNIKENQRKMFLMQEYICRETLNSSCVPIWYKYENTTQGGTE